MKKRVKRRVKKLTLKEAYENVRKQAARDRRYFTTLFNVVSELLGKIQGEQNKITRSVDAVMKDYIRHPLKIDGMSQSAFRSLVDAAARNHPQMFKDDFNGRLGPDE